MSKRVEGVKRGAAGIVFYTLGSIVVLIVSLLMMLYAIVDIIWQIVFGGDGLAADGSYVGDVHEWWTDNHRWIAFGEGNPQLAPSF